MNFYTIIIWGYIILAAILAYFILRDRRKPEIFWGRHKKSALIVTVILIFGIFCAIDARYIEPYRLAVKNYNLQSDSTRAPLKIALVADLHIGYHKKTEWVKKVAQKIISENPDIVILNGDFIYNDGTFEDESAFLTPLIELSARFPVYATLGNHEYGISDYSQFPKSSLQVGDHSAEMIERLKTLNIKLLKNDLACTTVKKQEICFYGIDDLWGGPVSFGNLNEWNKISPLIYLTHNPDGVTLWPLSEKPILTLSGHSHNGQVFIPFIGPLGRAGIELDVNYYYGLKNWDNMKMIITGGAGESGGPIRFLNPPEIVIIEI